jgi:hypothetical protein
MKCKSRFCDLESGHLWKCQRLTVANTPQVVANAESVRVKDWRGKNRDRYNERERKRMRLKRAGFIGIAYG